MCHRVPARGAGTDDASGIDAKIETIRRNQRAFRDQEVAELVLTLARLQDAARSDALGFRYIGRAFCADLANRGGQ